MTEAQPTTILFADLAGSTGLYERLGDAAAHGVVSEALEGWSQVVLRHGGRVVKTLGDGLFAVLPEPRAGVAAAEDLHRQLDLQAGQQPVRLIGRVAVHAGVVIEKDGDLFGDAVNVTARLAALAQPRQILASGELAALLPDAVRGDVRSLGKTRVRGRATEVELHEWVWEKAMVTRLVSRGPQAGKVATLVLKIGATTVRVGAERPQVTIGRQPFNDLVVDDERVSRVHARIEMRGSRFVLLDESSNGTHVMPMAGAAMVLRREEGDLGTMGFIGLGGAPFPGQTHTIEYQAEFTAPPAESA